MWGAAFKTLKSISLIEPTKNKNQNCHQQCKNKQSVHSPTWHIIPARHKQGIRSYAAAQSRWHKTVHHNRNDPNFMDTVKSLQLTQTHIRLLFDQGLYHLQCSLHCLTIAIMH